MESIKQEILELRKEVVTLKAGMEHLTALVEALVAAQVNPPMMEERMAKVFLETLSSFFPKGTVVSTPADFHREVDMKVLLEKDVRKECLFEEGNSAGSVKKFGNDFSKKRENQGRKQSSPTSSCFLCHSYIQFSSCNPRLSAEYSSTRFSTERAKS